MDSDGSVLKRGFLDHQERADFLRIVKDGREEHRVSRRANALLLLDDGMSYEQVAKVLYLDDSTVRAWRKSYEEAGVESTYAFDLKGSASLLSKLQTDELRVWVTQVLPETTEVVGKFILDRFGLEYGKSGLIKLMHRIGFDWKKPETIPAKIDAETQREFIEAYEDLRNCLGPDETMVFADAVHPTHQSSPGGRWLPRDARCAVPVSSGRERINLHGAIDLETGATRIIEVETVDAKSSIALFSSLEMAFPTMTKIHVYLDNARYHHAKLVKEWLELPGRKIVLHFVPAYCPHLNPIERLWFVMHKNISNRLHFPKFKDWADAILTFLRETVPENFELFSSTITDNFRIIDPKKFRIVA
jgi:transposase